MHPVYHRRSIRLKGYDYTQAGAYFVTLVSRHRECIFGEVEEDQVHLNPIGIIIEASWKNLEHNFPIILDKWVIMPNHFHGIIFLDPNRTGEALANRRMNRSESKMANASPQRPIGTQSGSLGAIIQNFKSISTRKLNKARSTPGIPIWQRNYYEHIIRDEDELNRVRQYILDNPLKWALDQENPKCP